MQIKKGKNSFRFYFFNISKLEYILSVCLAMFSLSLYSSNEDSLKIEHHKQRIYDLFDQSRFYDSISFHLGELEILSKAIKDHENYIFSLLANATISELNENKQDKVCYIKRSYNEGKKLLQDDDQLWASVYNNLADYYREIGDYLTSKNLLVSALEQLKNQPRSNESYESLITISINLAQSWTNYGDFRESVIQLNHARKMVLDSINSIPELRLELSRINYNLGANYSYLGEHIKAIQAYSQNLVYLEKEFFNPIKETIKNRISLADTYLDIDEILLASEQLEKISSYFSEKNDRTPYKYREENYWNIKSKLFKKRILLDSALFSIRRGIAASSLKNSDIKRIPLKGNLLISEGKILQAKKDYKNALEKYFEALYHFNIDHAIDAGVDLEKISTVNKKTFETIYLISKIYKNDIAQLTVARKFSLLLIELFDLYRKQLQTLDAQLFTSNELRPAFEQAIEISLKLHEITGEPKYLQEAFGLAEKGKAILLSNALNDTYAKYSGGVPDSLLDEERELKANISFYKNLIFKEENKIAGIDSLKIDNWERKLFELEREQEDFDKILAQNYPDYHDYLNQEEAINVSDIQRNLGRNTCLLEFFAGDSSLYIFFLDKDGLSYREISSPEEIYNKIEEFSTSFRTKNSKSQSISEFKESASYLFNELIGKKVSSYSKLIFIPDGQLGKIPFEFLLTKEDPSSSFSELAYLGKSLDIQYAYSAKLLYQDPLKRNRKTASKLWGGFAPHFEGEKKLVFNGQEVKGINTLMQGDVFLDHEANLKKAKQNIDQYKILHFATHGYSQMERPMFSRIEFTYQDSLNDGVFYAHDLMNHKINADLVVLSACETGEGKIAKGEGIMSFAWAFRYAGAPSVLMSLWKAESSVSQRIMLSFYSYLKEGKSKTEALRLAKQDYIQNPIAGREHPKYWVNFILIGDDAPIFVDPRLKWVALMGLMLFLGLVAQEIFRIRSSN